MRSVQPVLCALLLGVTLLGQQPLSDSIAQVESSKPDEAASSTTRTPSSNIPEGSMRGAGEVGEMPLYRPPLRGAPGGRLAGGTRGAASKMIALSFLAPKHTGLTVEEQPVLYWFSSASTKYPVELTILKEGVPKPLLQVVVSSETQAGFHPIRLADFGIRLQVGVVYECFVAMVSDPKRRSQDLISGGAIQRIAYPKNLEKKLKESAIKRIPHVYAEEGLWYDALGALCDRIATVPDDLLLHKQRISLLRQAGLEDTADHAMRQSIPYKRK